MFVLDDLTGWEAAMIAELGARKFHGAWVRIHDSGDYFSDEYLKSWLRICRARPNVRFYCYTKEISRFRRLVEPEPPPKPALGVFVWRHSRPQPRPHHRPRGRRFPDEQAITEAGWSSQEASDLLAVLGPRLVGIPANRIPAFVRQLAHRRFSEWQAEADQVAAERAARRRNRGPSSGPGSEPQVPRRSAA